MRNNAAVICAFAAAISLVPAADACTRIVYQGAGSSHLVGRTMDWLEETRTDLWAFPAGLVRDGGIGSNSIKWTSKYGSVIAAMYNVGTVDGMNDAGLAGNLLYLTNSDYGDYRFSKKPLLSIGAWLQYVLDNYATVAEAVSALSKEPFTIVAPALPNGSAAQGHLAITDKSGDTAIVEYTGGKLQIYHGKQFKVMTNEPTFDQQLAITTYWKTVGGLNFLPGTNRASDRFARMSWMVDAVPTGLGGDAAVAQVMSLIRAISAPLGLSDPLKPNIAATRWRTLTDINAGRYFFDSVHTPSVFWVDLGLLNLKVGAPSLKLDLSGQRILSGETSQEFKPAQPFKFLAPHS